MEAFDYHLPEELIAQEPLSKRDQSRLLVLRRKDRTIEHSVFEKLPEYLIRDDCMVLNNTRVIPARLLGKRRETGGYAEILLLHQLDESRWTAMVRPGRRLKPGAEVDFTGGLRALIEDYHGEGKRLVRFFAPDRLQESLEKAGSIPLPPYIVKELSDSSRYQTIYAREKGSSAAPTAGFHFTPAVFGDLEQKGVNRTFFTLHIGPGTFQPVKTEDIRAHVMHREYYRMPDAAARRINETREKGGRVLAVGTTACRVMETTALPGGLVEPREGWTDLFIYPGYQFQAVDALLTNFHLPRSTLLMLVSAFAGHSAIMDAYREAVREEYRFYSFGDAMLII